jgi:YtkA-like
MNSLQALARTAAQLAAIATFALLSACSAPKSPYVFTAVNTKIAMTGEAVVDVRLVHEATGKPVENAVIFDTRFDMAPDSMASMTAPVEAQGSPAPGVYRFKVAPTMKGRWALTLSAKVQGVAETITGTVVVTAH